MRKKILSPKRTTMAKFIRAGIKRQTTKSKLRVKKK